MSQTIELKDEVFTTLKQNADKDGVTPEAWIEIVVEEKSNGFNLPKISDEERAKMHRYSKELDRKFGEILKAKMRKQGLNLS